MCPLPVHSPQSVSNQNPWEMVNRQMLALFDVDSLPSSLESWIFGHDVFAGCQRNLQYCWERWLTGFLQVGIEAYSHNRFWPLENPRTVDREPTVEAMLADCVLIVGSNVPGETHCFRILVGTRQMCVLGKTNPRRASPCGDIAAS